MSQPNQDLERLWDGFLEDVNKLGYIVEPRTEIKLKPANQRSSHVSKHESFVSPSEMELVSMGHKSFYSLSKRDQERYNAANG